MGGFMMLPTITSRKLDRRNGFWARRGGGSEQGRAGSARQRGVQVSEPCAGVSLGIGGSRCSSRRPPADHHPPIVPEE